MELHLIFICINGYEGISVAKKKPDAIKVSRSNTNKSRSINSSSSNIRDVLYAKSKNYGGNTLYNHSLDAARMALTISEYIYSNNDKAETRRCSFISALFHDFGKAAEGFQQMISFTTRKWPPHEGGNRHEILSASILLTNLGKLDNWLNNKNELSSIYLAIITHHKPFKEELHNYPKKIPDNQWFGKCNFLSMYRELLRNKELLIKIWDELIILLKKDKWGNSLIEKGWLPEVLEIIPENEIVDKLLQFYKIYKINGYEFGLINKKQFYESYNSDEVLFFTKIRAITTVADHLSSGGNYYIPPKPIIERYGVFKDKNIKIRAFQKKMGTLKGSVMLRAPTGSGKTEASYNWIRSNQRRIVNNSEYYGNLFYILPFQASINAMYKRLNSWFDAEEGQLVGLQHSRSANTLYSIIEDEIEEYNALNNKSDGWKSILRRFENPWKKDNIQSFVLDDFSDLIINREEARKKLKENKSKKSNDKFKNSVAYNLSNLSREIFYPVKISTPHQILKGILQGRGWESYIFDYFESTIVFDEIHAYDPHLSGMILSTSKLLIEIFNARILFMSASFPEFLIDKIREIIPDIPIIELDSTIKSDYEVLSKTRHMVKIKDKTISEVVVTDEFLDKLDNSESTLIICNTVSVAQKVYSQLKRIITSKYGEESIVLFHSRFKIKDRFNKEKLIQQINSDMNKLRVVVATQVVEVSLDIDLEFGIFEAAPLDALVQRFGRVNRKGKRSSFSNNIWICNPEGYSHLIYNQNKSEYTIELLKSIEGLKISENKLVELINKLYKRHPWTDREEKIFKSAFDYSKIRNFKDFILPGSYRYWIDDIIDEQTSMDVILMEDQFEYRKQKRISALKAHGLIIPMRARKINLMKNGNNPSIFVGEYTYTEELGLIKGDKK